MTTATTLDDRRPATPWGAADTPIPFVRLVLVELRKAVDTRAARGVLGTFVGLGILTLVLSLLQDPGGSLATGARPAVVLAVGFPVIGVLIMTSEWGQRTTMTTFRLVTRRRRVLLAKLVAALVVSSGTVTAMHVVCLAATAVALIAQGTALSTEGLGETLKVAYVSVLCTTLLGLAWGALLRSTGVALVFTIVVPIVLDMGIAFTLGDVAPWVSSGTFGGWALGELSFEPPVATSAILWYVAPLVVGCWLQSRVEVR